MKTRNFKGISLEDLAFAVSDHLAGNGIDAVLTGGACVSLYTKNEYLSFDLDFVLISFEKKPRLRATMEALGFRLESGFFKHRDTPFFVEFLPPPPSVGEEPVKNISTLGKNGLRLKLLSPTDCVKDRLAACGLKGVSFSGSGPAVFALTRTREQAQEAVDILSKRYRQVYAVRTL